MASNIDISIIRHRSQDMNQKNKFDFWKVWSEEVYIPRIIHLS